MIIDYISLFRTDRFLSEIISDALSKVVLIKKKKIKVNTMDFFIKKMIASINKLPD